MADPLFLRRSLRFTNDDVGVASHFGIVTTAVDVALDVGTNDSLDLLIHFGCCWIIIY